MTPDARRMAVWIAHLYEVEAEGVCNRYPYSEADDREAGALYEAATQMSERALRGVHPDHQDAAWARAMDSWTLPDATATLPLRRTLSHGC